MDIDSVVVGLISFACLFGGALLGMWLRTRLPGRHLNEDSQRIVNLGAGIIGTRAALVLGLLDASARGNFDAQSNELTTMAAKLVLLDHGLALYGRGCGYLLNHVTDFSWQYILNAA